METDKKIIDTNWASEKCSFYVVKGRVVIAQKGDKKKSFMSAD